VVFLKTSTKEEYELRSVQGYMKNYEFMRNSMKKSMQRELKLAVGQFGTHHALLMILYGPKGWIIL
jgi:hypothetical protein